MNLYFISDDVFWNKSDCLEHLEKMLTAGVDCVQLRVKNMPQRKLVELGFKLKTILHSHEVPLIVNDDIDVAQAIDAEGIHLGQSDLAPLAAREILGHQKIIGFSIENMSQALAANDLDVDYLGVGPVFPTQTKLDAAPPIGIETLEAICQNSKHYICAIGGINLENINSIYQAGAHSVAISSCLSQSETPTLTTKKLRKQCKNPIEL